MQEVLKVTKRKMKVRKEKCVSHCSYATPFRGVAWIFLSLLLCHCALAASPPFYLKASHAQAHEDMYLYETFFFNKTGGVILESGALDGIRYSTSFMFEMMFNWTSIHIEGDVKNYERLVKNRPNATNMNIALCDVNRTLHYLNHKGAAVSGLREFMDVGFLMWRYSNPNEYNETEVECLTMRDAMRQVNVTHVDIWVLDIEGGELFALKGVDFTSFQADVILIETNSGRSKRSLNFLAQHEYNCTLLDGTKSRIRNHVCVRKGFVPSCATKLWDPADAQDYPTSTVAPAGHPSTSLFGPATTPTKTVTTVATSSTSTSRGRDTSFIFFVIIMIIVMITRQYWKRAKAKF